MPAHEVWARFFASSLEDRLRYTPSDCFETFPLPEPIDSPPLEVVGRDYYDFRAALMVEYDEGLTRIYNRFHDPDERSNAVGELRRLHDAMDRAVLDAYGWTDIRRTCEFALEWEDDEQRTAGGGASRGAIAGPSRCATMYRRGCSRSTPSAPRKSALRSGIGNEEY
jgi:hypothetical protein